jgi:hypothetical protein
MSATPPLPPLKDDGLPTLPTGEPVLARWFVVAMLVLVPVAIVITAWAFLSIPRDELTPAERRPPGDGQITIERGAAEFGESTDVELGPSPCGEAIELIGDDGTRATSRRALATVCELLRDGTFQPARDGLSEWIRGDGLLRIAIFELSGVESSARVEDERLVLELNAKFQFDDAARAAPALIHQLTLLSQADWPGRPITAETELAGVEAQAAACERLQFDGPTPRGCLDVEELLADDDPFGLLVDAGYPARG